MSGSKFKIEKTELGLATSDTTKSSKFKRSNSYVGVGHQNQRNQLDNKDTGE